MLKPLSRKRLATLWGLLVLPVTGCCGAYLGYQFAVQRGYVAANRPWIWSTAEQMKVWQAAFFAFGLFAAVRRAVRAAMDLRRTESFELAVPVWSAPVANTAARRADELIQNLETWPKSIASLAITHRIRAALRFIARTDATHGLAQELRVLAAVDEERYRKSRSWERLAIVFVLLMATMAALHSTRSVLARDSQNRSGVFVSSQQSTARWMLSVTQHASNACGMLSILLVASFLANRFEDYWLSQLERRANHFLWDVFGNDRITNDAQVATLQRIAQTTLSAIDKASRDQAESWKDAWTQWYDQWNRTLAERERQWTTAVEQSLRGRVDSQQDRFLQLEKSAIERLAQQNSQWQQLLQRFTDRLETQQSELSRQTEILLKVLEATGEVQNLERSLNQNLRALAGAKNFEDTVMSLSAAIQLLSTRLGRNVSPETRVQLQPVAGQERAA